MLGLRFCARAFSSCGERGPLFIAVRGPLTVMASPVAEHRLQTRRLSSCGSRAQPLRGMWDLPRPGHEPVSPALAGGFPTTAPPGKPLDIFYVKIISNLWKCSKISTESSHVTRLTIFILYFATFGFFPSFSPSLCVFVPVYVCVYVCVYLLSLSVLFSLSHIFS